MELTDDDAMIIEGLQTIREGLIKKDIDMILGGYNYITGEGLQLESRIEKIQKAFKKPKSKQKPVDTIDSKVETIDNEQIVIAKDGNGLQIISSAYDPKEAEENAKKTTRTKLPKRDASKPLYENFKKETGDIRYRDYNPNESK